MGGSLRQWRWGGGQRGERSRRAGGALLGLHRPAVAAATPAAPRGWSGEAKVPAGVCPPLQGVVTREVAPDAWRDLYTRVGVPREVGDGTGRDGTTFWSPLRPHWKWEVLFCRDAPWLM